MSIHPDVVRLLKHCKDKSFYAYGTTRIFEKRAYKLSRLRNLITFFGVAVPVTVGSLILSFGALPQLLPWLLAVAGVIGTIQLILSVWSLVARWDEAYVHAVASVQANTKLYNAWQRLLNFPPPDLAARVQEFDEEDQRQEQSDLPQHITEREKRYAMRAALLYFGLACATCKTTPISMKPTACHTCGK